MTIDHEFGGQHTELKLSIVESYLKFFSTALRPHFANLIYIDAFAGTGKRTVRVEARAGNLLDEAVQESVEQRRGSAQIAIDVVPHFTKLIFIEQNPRYCEALNAVAAAHSGRDIEVIEGDANSELARVLAAIDWKDTRAVLFLDPYGMEVEWSTLAAIAATKCIDVWFLFSLSGLYRQATRDKRSIDDDKRQALNRMLGTTAWEDELYSKQTHGGLFGNETTELRNADVKGLESYVKARLETIFPKVFDPMPLPIEQRPQRYSLFCAISNAAPKAIGLASKAANHILKAGISSKVAPR
jgi:three-Cys-motif partner protein